MRVRVLKVCVALCSLFLCSLALPLHEDKSSRACASSAAERHPSLAAPVLGLDLPGVAHLALRSEHAHKGSADVLRVRVRAPQQPKLPFELMS